MNPFSSEFVHTLLNTEMSKTGMKQLDLETTTRLVKKSFKNAVVTQIGNFFHIHLDDANQKYTTLVYNYVSNIVLSTFHYEHQYSKDQLSEVIQKIKQIPKNHISRSWISVKYPVFGETTVQCLFDGEQWIAMTCKDSSFSLELLNQALNKQQLSVKMLDPECNYFFQYDHETQSIYIKRIINRQTWKQVFTGPFIEKLLIPFDTKENKTHIPYKSNEEVIAKLLQFQLSNHRVFRQIKPKTMMKRKIFLIISTFHFYIQIE